MSSSTRIVLRKPAHRNHLRTLRLENLERRDLLAQLTVTTPLDLGDLNIGDGQCTVSGGLCSLRAAIEESNALPGSDVIDFNLPGFGIHKIRPNEFGLGPLPGITDTVVIDAYTQPGAFANMNPAGQALNGSPTIELDGSLLASGSGISIDSPVPGVVVRGLVIQNFPDHGVFITDTSGDSRGGHRIEGNYIGTDFTGLQDRGNEGDGVRIVASSHNVIGGITPAARNLISGNGSGTFSFSDGIDIRDIDIPGDRLAAATDNRIEGNLIGSDRRGSLAIPNADNGILLTSVSEDPDAGVHRTTIGGSVDGAANLISGNGSATFGIGRSGIYLAGIQSQVRPMGPIFDSVTTTQIQGNRIGTIIDGLQALPNLVDGVAIFGAVTTNLDDNLASGNNRHGVAIFDGFCAAIDYTEYLPPNPAVFSVTCQGGRNVVTQNLIGTDQTGLAPLPNLANGVWIFGVPRNTIGGQNVISANSVHGVEIDGFPSPASVPTGVENTVNDNLVGLGLDAVTVLGNGQRGVALTNSASDNDVEMNTISFNGAEGVSIDGFLNRVRSNTVVSNSGHGVEILEGTSNSISRNDISDNGGLGINLFDTNDPGDGVTPNDDGDPDGGANFLQNFPEVYLIGGTNQFAFDIDSTQNASFRIELFTNTTCDSAGEGETFLTDVVVSTDATGFLRPEHKIMVTSVPVPEGSFVTATATNLATGDTSEFSGCHVANGLVRGQKFNDLNGDGVRDATEPGLNGWTIELVDTTNSQNRFTFESTSFDLNDDGEIDPINETGIFVFPMVKPGTYVLSEEFRDGWQQTLPGPPNFTYTITVLPGGQVIRDFGNTMVAGDFDGDGQLTLVDIDQLSLKAASGNHDPVFDLTEDGLVNLADVIFWVENLRHTIMGDANLDNVVDGSDFNIWNANKFTTNTAWSAGNLNADNVVDGSDFNIWNQNKFQAAPRSIPGFHQQPEELHARDTIFAILEFGAKESTTEYSALNVSQYYHRGLARSGISSWHDGALGQAFVQRGTDSCLGSVARPGEDWRSIL